MIRIRFSRLRSLSLVSCVIFLLLSALAGAVETSATRYVYSGGEHEFPIDLKKGEGVTISLDAYLNSNWLRLTVVDPGGHTVGQSGYIYSLDSDAIDVVASTSGTYLIRISGASGTTGVYDLSIFAAWPNSGVADSDRDFSRTPLTSKYLASGDYTRSTEPSGSTKDDYFRFSAENGDIPDISITAGTNNTSYIRMALLNDANTVLVQSGYTYSGQTSRIQETLYRSGVYFLRVEGGSGSYTLNVNDLRSNLDTDGDTIEADVEYFHRTSPTTSNTDGDGADDATEIGNGDNPRAAMHLTLAETASASTAAIPVPYWNALFSADTASGQPSYWKLDLEAGEEYTVSVTATLGSYYLSAKLYDNNGNYAGGTGYTYHGETRFFDYQVPQGGTYVLKVENYSGMGFYELAVYPSWKNTNTRDSDRDFHSTFVSAHYVCNGNHQRGRTPDGSSMDDYYRFEVDFFDQLEVDLTAHFPNNSYLRATLYDPFGSTLQSSSYAYDGNTVVLSRQLFTAGTYFLKIVGGADGNYDLDVTGVTATPPDDCRDYDADNDAERSRRVRLYLNTILSTF